ARSATVPAQNWVPLRRWITGTGAGLLATILAIIWAAFQYPFKGAETHDAVTSGLSRAAVLVLILGAFLALQKLKNPAWQKPARVIILLLLWLDVMSAGPRPNPTVSREVYEPHFAVRELRMDPAPQAGTARAMLDAQAESNLSVTQMTNGMNDVLYRRLA